jgi:hypothetical protein
VSRGQAGKNWLRGGILAFANIGNVTIAKDSLTWVGSTLTQQTLIGLALTLNTFNLILRNYP